MRLIFTLLFVQVLQFSHWANEFVLFSVKDSSETQENFICNEFQVNAQDQEDGWNFIVKSSIFAEQDKSSKIILRQEFRLDRIRGEIFELKNSSQAFEIKSFPFQCHQKLKTQNIEQSYRLVVEKEDKQLIVSIFPGPVLKENKVIARYFFFNDEDGKKIEANLCLIFPFGEKRDKTILKPPYYTNFYSMKEEVYIRSLNSLPMKIEIQPRGYWQYVSGKKVFITRITGTPVNGKGMIGYSNCLAFTKEPDMKFWIFPDGGGFFWGNPKYQSLLQEKALSVTESENILLGGFNRSNPLISNAGASVSYQPLLVPVTLSFQKNRVLIKLSTAPMIIYEFLL